MQKFFINLLTRQVRLVLAEYIVADRVAHHSNVEHNVPDDRVETGIETRIETFKKNVAEMFLK